MGSNNLQKDKGTYVLAEVIPFALCGTALAIVLKENDKAITLFEK